MCWRVEQCWGDAQPLYTATVPLPLPHCPYPTCAPGRLNDGMATPAQWRFSFGEVLPVGAGGVGGASAKFSNTCVIAPFRSPRASEQVRGPVSK
jgi:hypothetical protein